MKSRTIKRAISQHKEQGNRPSAAHALLQVTAIKRQDYTRSPEAPYMTSTMLMDAANQLGSNVGSTIAAAQGLFEGDIKDSQADQGCPCSLLRPLLPLTPTFAGQCQQQTDSFVVAAL